MESLNNNDVQRSRSCFVRHPTALLPLAVMLVFNCSNVRPRVHVITPPEDKARSGPLIVFSSISDVDRAFRTVAEVSLKGGRGATDKDLSRELVEIADYFNGDAVVIVAAQNFVPVSARGSVLRSGGALPVVKVGIGQFDRKFADALVVSFRGPGRTAPSSPSAPAAQAAPSVSQERVLPATVREFA